MCWGWCCCKPARKRPSVLRRSHSRSVNGVHKKTDKLIKNINKFKGTTEEDPGYIRIKGKIEKAEKKLRKHGEDLQPQNRQLYDETLKKTKECHKLLNDKLKENQDKAKAKTGDHDDEEVFVEEVTGEEHKSEETPDKRKPVSSIETSAQIHKRSSPMKIGEKTEGNVPSIRSGSAEERRGCFTKAGTGPKGHEGYYSGKGGYENVGRKSAEGRINPNSFPREGLQKIRLGNKEDSFTKSGSKEYERYYNERHQNIKLEYTGGGKKSYALEVSTQLKEEPEKKGSQKVKEETMEAKIVEKVEEKSYSRGYKNTRPESAAEGPHKSVEKPNSSEREKLALHPDLVDVNLHYEPHNFTGNMETSTTTSDSMLDRKIEHGDFNLEPSLSRNNDHHQQGLTDSGTQEVTFFNHQQPTTEEFEKLLSDKLKEAIKSETDGKEKHADDGAFVEEVTEEESAPEEYIAKRKTFKPKVVQVESIEARPQIQKLSSPMNIGLRLMLNTMLDPPYRKAEEESEGKLPLVRSANSVERNSCCTETDTGSKGYEGYSRKVGPKSAEEKKYPTEENTLLSPENITFGNKEDNFTKTGLESAGGGKRSYEWGVSTQLKEEPEKKESKKVKEETTEAKILEKVEQSFYNRRHEYRRSESAEKGVYKSVEKPSLSEEEKTQLPGVNIQLLPFGSHTFTGNMETSTTASDSMLESKIEDRDSSLGASLSRNNDHYQQGLFDSETKEDTSLNQHPTTEECQKLLSETVEESQDDLNEGMKSETDDHEKHDDDGVLEEEVTGEERKFEEPNWVTVESIEASLQIQKGSSAREIGVQGVLDTMLDSLHGKTEEETDGNVSSTWSGSAEESKRCFAETKTGPTGFEGYSRKVGPKSAEGKIYPTRESTLPREGRVGNKEDNFTKTVLESAGEKRSYVPLGAEPKNMGSKKVKKETTETSVSEKVEEISYNRGHENTSEAEEPLKSVGESSSLPVSEPQNVDETSEKEKGSVKQRTKRKKTEDNQNFKKPQLRVPPKPEKQLEIFDVSKLFRDDFDLNSLDQLGYAERIEKISTHAKTFEDTVNAFEEEKFSIEYFVLDEKLMRLVEKLDKIKCDDDEVTTKKILVIEYIKQLHATLDQRAKDDD